MKKVFLVLLCAGLFVACGNKKQKADELVADTVAVETVAEEVVEEPVVEEPVAEQPKAATPAKKTTKPAPKKSNTGIQEAKTSQPAPTVQEHAKQAASRVANAAISKAEKDATNGIQQGTGTPNKARR